MTDIVIRRSEMSSEAFAAYGGTEVAYVKPVCCEEAAELYPNMPFRAQWFMLFALHAADGSLIAIKDSREDALEDASTRKLFAVSVH
jgi:hypothetical protein